MSRTDGPAAVLWDMDGTLVDSEKLWDVSLHGLARHLGGELSAEGRAAMVGGAMDSTVALMFAELNLSAKATAAASAEARRWLTRRTGELFAAGMPWRPGALAALRTVRDAGLRTALVTSTERGLTELALESIGREFFDVTVCGDEVTATKPAPEPYRRAAELLGVPVRSCVAVEDSPTGAAAAAAAGCAVLVVPSEVAVPPGHGRRERTSLVDLSLDGLTRLWRECIEDDHLSSETGHSAPGSPVG